MTADPSLRFGLLGKELKDSTTQARKYAFEKAWLNDDKGMMNEIIRADKRKFDIMQRFQEVYDGAVNGAGVSPRKAAEMMKEAGLSETDISMIRRGKVPSSMEDFKPGELSKTLSKKSMETLLDRAGPLSPAERAEKKKMLEEARRRMRAQGAASNE